jgi:hypothetical protein
VAKQAKNQKKRADPMPEPVSQPPHGWEKYFPYLISLVFFILSLFGILHHEMWRDEYQAWMVAADAHSIPELFKNLKYEGNPVLWHAFLYILSALTDNPFSMQLFHILISTSFIFLFNRYAPHSLVEKILFTFGYFTFFEYNLISRSYGLGLLLIVIFCILYRNRYKNILLMAGVLFLLANDTIFGVILTVCFSFIIVLERLFVRNKKSKEPKIPFSKLALFVGITFIGVLLGYLQVKPEPDNSFPTLYVTDFNLVRLKWAFSRLIHGYFAVPNFTHFHFWNTNFFVPDESKFLIGITPVLFVAWIIAFMRYRLVTVLYVTGTLILLAFYYYTGFIWSRYSGHLFLLLIACSWLVYYQKGKPYQINWLEKTATLGDKIRTPFLITILAVHVIGGVMAYYKDIKYPFSTSHQAADFIRDHQLDKYEMIGSVDYVISPLVSQLGRKILYAERKEYGSFIIYDQKRTNIWSFSAVQDYIREMVTRGNNRIILLKSSQIMRTYDDTGESEPWIEGMLDDSLAMKLITTIEPGIVEDEIYYIYSVDKVQPE